MHVILKSDLNSITFRYKLDPLVVKVFTVNVLDAIALDVCDDASADCASRC